MGGQPFICHREEACGRRSDLLIIREIAAPHKQGLAMTYKSKSGILNDLSGPEPFVFTPFRSGEPKRREVTKDVSKGGVEIESYFNRFWFEGERNCLF